MGALSRAGGADQGEASLSTECDEDEGEDQGEADTRGDKFAEGESAQGASSRGGGFKEGGGVSVGTTPVSGGLVNVSEEVGWVKPSFTLKVIGGRDGSLSVGKKAAGALLQGVFCSTAAGGAIGGAPHRELSDCSDFDDTDVARFDEMPSAASEYILEWGTCFS